MLGEFVRDTSDKHSPINVPYYSKDTEIARCNQDTHATNEQGKLILDLCKSNSLRNLNGRLSGDTSGKFTRYPKRTNENPSTIDYALCGEALLPQLFSFSVLPFTELSDHCCISTNIRINIPQKSETPAENSEIRINPEEPKLSYEKDRKHNFQANVMLSDQRDHTLT